MYDLQQNGQFREISALACFQIVFSVALLMIAKPFVDKRSQLHA